MYLFVRLQALYDAYGVPIVDMLGGRLIGYECGKQTGGYNVSHTGRYSVRPDMVCSDITTTLF
jgi:hypothetical protein